eukprot:943297-Amphidinium_carterae.1
MLGLYGTKRDLVVATFGNELITSIKNKWPEHLLVWFVPFCAEQTNLRNAISQQAFATQVYFYLLGVSQVKVSQSLST